MMRWIKLLKFEFKCPEERTFLELIQSMLNSPIAQKILDDQGICSSSEAAALAEFFWALVDKSIELEKLGELDQFLEGAEFWNEKLMYSISGYLERIGFENEWEEVVDRQ